jgi:uncharacterized membrane protein YccC
VLRALETQLCLLLPLASAVEDRCRQLQRADALPPAVHVLLDDVVAWLGAPDGEGASPEALRARARACEPDCRLPFAWHAALQLSMLDRLAELVAVHAICRELQAAMGADRIPLSPPAREAIRNARRRVLHRDYGLALRGALATSLTVLIGCLLWILSAWPAGQHFDRLGARGQADPDPALVRAIDTALATIGRNGAVDDRRLALLALTSLRRNIAPDIPLSPRRDRENSAAA